MSAEQRGFTLVEVIIAIAIIAVAVGGVMLVFVVALTHSTDPQQQAVAIAEGYMDEILSRRYDDPDGVALREASRDLFDDVDDYDGINEAPQDQEGDMIPGLGDYRVQVDVTPSTALGPPARP